MWFNNIIELSSTFIELASFRINDPKTLISDVSPLSLDLELSMYLPAYSLPGFSPSHQGPEAAGPSGPRSAQHPVPASGPLRTVAAVSAWPGASPGLASAQRLHPCMRKAEARIQSQEHGLAFTLNHNS